MTEEDYNRIVRERPDLLLPDYHNLEVGFRMALVAIEPERLIAGRTAVLLGRKNAGIPEIISDDRNFKYV